MLPILRKWDKVRVLGWGWGLFTITVIVLEGWLYNRYWVDLLRQFMDKRAWKF